MRCFGIETSGNEVVAVLGFLLELTKKTHGLHFHGNPFSDPVYALFVPGSALDTDQFFEQTKHLGLVIVYIGVDKRIHGVLVLWFHKGKCFIFVYALLCIWILNHFAVPGFFQDDLPIFSTLHIASVEGDFSAGRRNIARDGISGNIAVHAFISKTR